MEYKFKRGIVGYKFKVRWSGLSVDFFGPDLRLQPASANRRNQQRVKMCTMGEVVGVCSVQTQTGLVQIFCLLATDRSLSAQQRGFYKLQCTIPSAENAKRNKLGNK